MKKIFLKITVIMVIVAGSFYSCKESDILDGAVSSEYGATTRASDEGLFRYLDSERYYLEISPDMVIVKFNREMTEDALESSFRGDALLPVSDISAMNGNEFKLMRFDDNSRSSMNELTTELMSNDAISFVGYVIIDEIGKTSALTNQINVMLKSDNDFPILQEAIASFDISEVRQSEFDSRFFVLTLSCFSGRSALQMANELHRTGLFEFASPNLILFIRYATNDTHFSQQWGLRNTGQSGGTAGIDIRVQQAWTITTGSPDIRIAILDSGTDLNHPDFSGSFIPGLGFDATGWWNNGGDHSINPHGTAVAGIVAARGNNSMGIAGVAHTSRILPIHMGGTPSADRVKAGIDWSIANGARIINMSFTTTDTPEVRNSLDAATAANIVLVASSGNHNGAVRFPANRQDVIAVGAIDRCGRRSGRIDIIPDSCDPWGPNSSPGSAFGTNLDVVAPGTNIFTTGVLGFSGYGTVINNGANGVYFSGFSGTSAAAPHVAGIAALMLSVNRNLTAQQVRNIIKNTANRNLPNVTFVTTPGRPNGTWNEKMGHGLVDALAAVSAVAGNVVLFNDRTVSTNQIVAGGNIFSQNVTVTSNATLTFNANNMVTIEAPFTVNNNSQLVISVQ